MSLGLQELDADLVAIAALAGDPASVVEGLTQEAVKSLSDSELDRIIRALNGARSVVLSEGWRRLGRRLDGVEQ